MHVPTEYGFRPSPSPTAWTIRCRNQDHTNQNAAQRYTYTAYGIGCAAVWAVILVSQNRTDS